MHDLPFDRYRPEPGHPHWSRLAAEAHALAAELAPGLAPPRSGGVERRHRLRAHATTLRNFADNRRRAGEGRHDLWPLYFIWTVLRTCNFRCDYCDDHDRGPARPASPPATLR